MEAGEISHESVGQEGQTGGVRNELKLQSTAQFFFWEASVLLLRPFDRLNQAHRDYIGYLLYSKSTDYEC